MGEDNPGIAIYYNLLGLLYEQHPIRDRVAGTVESISHITAQTLYDCHKAFYVPANMCLILVGDVDRQKVIDLAERVLPRESGSVIERDYGAEESLVPHEKLTRCTMEISMPTFLAGFKCPPVPEGQERLRSGIIGELACDVLAGDSSPLFARLYAEGLVNGSFAASYDLLPGVACVSIGGDSNEPERVVEEILREAARLVAEGIDEDYFQRILRANFGTAIKGLNSFEGTAVSVAEGCFGSYDPFRFPEVYDSVTAADLLDFIRENIVEARMALSIIDPKEEENDVCND